MNAISLATGLLLAVNVSLYVRFLLQSKKRKSEESEVAPPRMLAFGDSVTEFGFNTETKGWLAQMQHWYARKVDVKSLGFSGYNSRWALLIMNRLFKKGGSTAKTALITIFLGINDASFDDSSQHVPLGEYRENMVKILNHLRHTYEKASIVLITPAPIHNSKLEKNLVEVYGSFLNRSSENALKYVQVCLEISKEYGIPALNLFEALGNGNQADFSSNFELLIQIF